MSDGDNFGFDSSHSKGGDDGASDQAPPPPSPEADGNFALEALGLGELLDAAGVAIAGVSAGTIIAVGAGVAAVILAGYGIYSVLTGESTTGQGVPTGAGTTAKDWSKPGSQAGGWSHGADGQPATGERWRPRQDGSAGDSAGEWSKVPDADGVIKQIMDTLSGQSGFGSGMSDSSGVDLNNDGDTSDPGESPSIDDGGNDPGPAVNLPGTDSGPFDPNGPEGGPAQTFVQLMAAGPLQSNEVRVVVIRLADGYVTTARRFLNYRAPW